MYMVGVNGFFSAVHSLEGDVPEHEKEPHTHDYKLEWTLELKALDERGFSLDISVLEEIRDQLFKTYADQNLNEFPFFDSKPVSLENFSDFTYDKLYAALTRRIEHKDTERITAMEIRLWENNQAWAGIRQELQ